MSEPEMVIGAQKAQWPWFRQESGLGLIAIIGLLGLLSVGLAVWSPALIRTWDRHDQEAEMRRLDLIGKGILTYLRQNKNFPSSLVSLTPDYVPYSMAQLTTNVRGFPRYYVLHPAMAVFNNRSGLTAGELLNVRFLLISSLAQDAAPAITSPAEFESWWNTNESLTPHLYINRTNAGHLFHSLAITPQGNGASVLINASPATDSGGGMLPVHNAFHLQGTMVGFDEALSYHIPEVQFALTANVAYWFNPLCTVSKRWNPLQVNCGNSGMVRDEFSALALNGNDGTQNWVNDWQEIGEADGPANGKMQVAAHAQCAAGNCFMFGGGGGGPPTEVRREADLSGAASASLTFSYRRGGGGSGGNIRLDASGDGGITWTTLQTYSMNGSDANQIPQTFDFTIYIGSKSQIRFVRNGNMTRRFYADNIEIAWN